MRIKIVQGYYAPKLNDIINHDDKIHCVVWPKCNFRCKICDFWQRDDIVFKELSLDHFEKVVDYLLPFGEAFKFTGGEPCLNPELVQMLEIVKGKGGLCFLDTNGSLPNVAKRCMDAGLIDVLAISIKDLDQNSICESAGIANKKLCWDNVRETISYAAQKNISTVVTKVIYDSFTYEELEQFAAFIKSCGDNIYLKINNLMENAYNSTMKPIPHEIAETIIHDFLRSNKDFTGRIIYIGDKKAVVNVDYIKHY